MRPEQILATAQVLSRQIDRMHALVGSIQDLRYSNPTIEQVQEMATRYREEREFSQYVIDEVDKIAKAK